MNQQSKSSYRNIMKGTAIFGGTQVYNVLIGVVRGKLIAMILGPVGMGISSLFTSAMAPIQQFASLGMPLSAVRNISGEKDEIYRQKIVKAFRMMLTTAASIGILITILTSGLLSKTTFGEEKYTLSFVALSLSVFFNVLAQGENTIMQGYRRLKSLATRSVIGSTAGLLIGVPLYYIYGVDGIVPAIIVLSFVSYVVAFWGTKKIGIHNYKLSWGEAFQISKTFIALGITMMVAVLLGFFSTYSLNIVIRYFGTIADVGLFQAANAIINQYIGMVFAAMATDYYPHLSSIIQDKKQVRELVKEEGEIILYIVVPLAVLIIITAPLIIKILLTSEFDSVLLIIRYMGLGVILKAAVFPLGYLSLAHGDKRFYFWMEGVWTNIKTFLLFALSYYFWGFAGLGYATLANSIVDIIVVVILNKWRYGISYSRKFSIQLFALYGITALCLLCSFIINPYLEYLSMIVIGAILCFYCFCQLDHRMDIRGIIATKLHRK